MQDGDFQYQGRGQASLKLPTTLIKGFVWLLLTQLDAAIFTAAIAGTGILTPVPAVGSPEGSCPGKRFRRRCQEQPRELSPPTGLGKLKLLRVEGRAHSPIGFEFQTTVLYPT